MATQIVDSQKPDSPTHPLDNVDVTPESPPSTHTNGFKRSPDKQQAALLQKLREFQHHLKLTNAEKNEWISEHAKIELELNESQEKCREIQANFDRATQEWNGKESYYSKDLAKKQQQLMNVRSEMYETESRLQGEVLLLKERQNETEHRLAESLAKVEDFQAKEVMFNNVKKQLHSQLSEANESLLSKQAEVESLNDSVAPLVANKAELCQEVCSVKELMKQQEKEFEEKVNDWSVKEGKLQAELNITNKKLTRVDASLSSAEERLVSTNLSKEQLQQDYQKLKNQFVSVKNDCQKQKERKELLKKQKRQLGKEIYSLREVIATQEKETVSSLSKIQALDKTIEEMSKTLEENKKTIEMLAVKVEQHKHFEARFESCQEASEQREMNQENLISMVDAIKNTLENMSVQRLRGNLKAPNTTDEERLELSNKCIASIMPEIKRMGSFYRNSYLSVDEDGKSDINDVFGDGFLDCYDDPLTQAMQDLFSDLLLANARLRMKMNSLVDRVLKDVDVIK